MTIALEHLSSERRQKALPIPPLACLPTDAAAAPNKKARTVQGDLAGICPGVVHHIEHSTVKSRYRKPMQAKTTSARLSTPTGVTGMGRAMSDAAVR